MHTIQQTLLARSAGKQLESKLLQSEALFAAAIPQPNRDLYRLAVQAACNNASAIVAEASAFSYLQAKRSNTISSTSEQFIVNNVLEWADWLQSATAEALGGECVKALDAKDAEHEHFTACEPYFENVINLGNLIKKNEREAVKDLIQQDPACVIYFVQLQMQIACALACMLGLPNAEIWPFPQRMYKGLIKSGRLQELPTHSIRPCWTYAHNQKKPG